MERLSILYQYPIWVNGLFFLATLLVSMGVGFLIGRYNLNSREKSAKRGKSDVVLTGMFALLGLILAFTYAFSLSRADARKQAVMEEANAIDTAFLRADLAPEPVRLELKTLLLEYARTRVISESDVTDSEVLRQIIGRSLEIQAQLWPVALKSIDAGVSGPREISILHSINDVLDAHTRRVVNGFDQLPTAVLLLMLIIASGALGVAGYNSGVAGHEDRWGLRVLSLLLAIVMLLITDFDRSHSGFIRIDQQPLVNAVNSMEHHLKPSG
jgi:hypothetical protein